MNKIAKKKKESNGKLMNVDVSSLTEVDELKLLNDLLVRRYEKTEDKVTTYDRAMESDGWMEMAEVSKTLNYKGMGRNNLFKFLIDQKILRDGYGRKGIHNTPYQQYVDRGYFKIIKLPYVDGYGKEQMDCKTMTSMKGLDFIRRRLDEYFGE